jgi:Tol biopolymer transport system component
MLSLALTQMASAALVNLKLSGAMPANGDVGRAGISPDGWRVVYVADQQTDETFELYSVPMGGGEVTRLDLAPTPDQGVQEYWFSPDGRLVVYSADQERDEVFELFVSFDGSAVHLPLILR